MIFILAFAYRGSNGEKLIMDERELIKNHMESVGHDIDSWEGISALIIHNLGNFAYRYISTDHDPQPKVIKPSESAFASHSLETNLLLGLKLGGEELRPHLIAMAKAIGKDATIAQRLRVEILDYRPRGRVELLLEAAISWNHPEHNFEQNFKARELKITYEDALEMRNKLALAQEEICAFF